MSSDRRHGKRLSTWSNRGEPGGRPPPPIPVAATLVVAFPSSVIPDSDRESIPVYGAAHPPVAGAESKDRAGGSPPLPIRHVRPTTPHPFPHVIPRPREGSQASLPDSTLSIAALNPLIPSSIVLINKTGEPYMCLPQDLDYSGKALCSHGLPDQKTLELAQPPVTTGPG